MKTKIFIALILLTLRGFGMEYFNSSSPMWRLSKEDLQQVIQANKSYGSSEYLAQLMNLADWPPIVNPGKTNYLVQPEQQEELRKMVTDWLKSQGTNLPPTVKVEFGGGGASVFGYGPVESPPKVKREGGTMVTNIAVVATIFYTTNHFDHPDYVRDEPWHTFDLYSVSQTTAFKFNWKDQQVTASTESRQVDMWTVHFTNGIPFGTNLEYK